MRLLGQPKTSTNSSRRPSERPLTKSVLAVRPPGRPRSPTLAHVRTILLLAPIRPPGARSRQWPNVATTAPRGRLGTFSRLTDGFPPPPRPPKTQSVRPAKLFPATCCQVDEGFRQFSIADRIGHLSPSREVKRNRTDSRWNRICRVLREPARQRLMFVATPGSCDYAGELWHFFPGGRFRLKVR
jgi:hypothetical protein